MSQDHAASEAMANFNTALSEAMLRNRIFFEDFAALVRDESLRFLNLRMDRTRQAMEQLNDCRGLPGLIGVQQAWLGEMLQDFTAQGLRYSELFSQSMERMQQEVSRQADSVAEAVEPALEEAQEAAQDAAQETAGQAAETMEEAVSYQQDYDQQPQVH